MLVESSIYYTEGVDCFSVMKPTLHEPKEKYLLRNIIAEAFYLVVTKGYSAYLQQSRGLLSFRENVVCKLYATLYGVYKDHKKTVKEMVKATLLHTLNASGMSYFVMKVKEGDIPVLVAYFSEYTNFFDSALVWYARKYELAHPLSISPDPTNKLKQLDDLFNDTFRWLEQRLLSGGSFRLSSFDPYLTSYTGYVPLDNDFLYRTKVFLSRCYDIPSFKD